MSCDMHMHHDMETHHMSSDMYSGGMSDDETGSDVGDPVERIEQALASLRRGGRSHWGPPHGGRPGRSPFFGPGGPHRHGAHGHGDGVPADPTEQGDAAPSGPPGRSGPFGGPGPRGPWEFRVGPVARARLLATLHAADRPMSVTELAGAIGVDQPRASRLVQAAVAEGLVVREADPDDARRTRVRITEAGRAAVRAASSTRRRAIESALDDFTDEERERFADLLGRFAIGLRRAHPPHD